MHSIAILLAIFGASNVLALPVDLQAEAANVDVRTIGKRSATPNSIINSTPECDEFGNPISNWSGSDSTDSLSDNSDFGWVPDATTKRSADLEKYKLDWAHGADCAINNFSSCVGGHGEAADNEGETPKAEAEKRWITPPATVPTNFGTECSLETCDMCPTFPGCGDDETRAGVVAAKENWAQPPMKKRDETLATEPVDVKGDWEQPPMISKRQPYISPIEAGGVYVGAGPECSAYTCDLCPDHPGCKTEVVGEPPKGDEA